MREASEVKLEKREPQRALQWSAFVGSCGGGGIAEDDTWSTGALSPVLAAGLLSQPAHRSSGSRPVDSRRRRSAHFRRATWFMRRL